MKHTSVIITCDHAGNRVPESLRDFFYDMAILSTHRAYDIGALKMARIVAKKLYAPLLYTTVTRLVVDCNRSIGSDELFSEFIKSSNIFFKNEILKRYYITYRSKIEKAVNSILQSSDEVFHISVHSFTPQLQGFARYTDIGLLYDQSRPKEALLCNRIKKALMDVYPLRVAFNYPFRGCGDGVTVWLRKQFGDSYCGIELEANQQIYFNSKRQWQLLSIHLAHAIEYAVNSLLRE